MGTIKALMPIHGSVNVTVNVNVVVNVDVVVSHEGDHARPRKFGRVPKVD